MTLTKLFLYFLKTGSTVFGGPLAIIHKIHEDLVHKKKWISNSEFEDIFGYSQLAPGTISFQVGLYIGYFSYGFWGAFLCGYGLILPSYILILAFSVFYKIYSTADFIQYALYGLSPAIIAIILHSGIRLSRNLIKKDYFLLFIFILSIVLTILFKVPIIYQIFPAAFIAVLFYTLREKKSNELNSFSFLSFAGISKAFIKFTGFISAIFFIADSRLAELAMLFLKTGSLTYGSGFVIVGVLQQEVVEKYHWLSQKDFLAGISFGNITPGPVTITSTFIGYMTEGFLGSVISTACIFLPTFILVLILAQVIKKYKDNFYLKAFIKGANAAALGAILSTAYNLSTGALIDKPTVLIFIITLIILFRFKINTLIILACATLCGIALKMYM
ncbi:chromate transporter [soil metagenome]